MKTLLYNVSLAALILSTAYSGPAARFLSTTQSVTIFPVSYVTTKGSSGGQPVSNLATLTESGTNDNWDAYVEFQTPGTSLYSGYQGFTLSSNIAASAISLMSLQINFRGPLSSYQVWTWSIYNWRAASWVKVGTNATAKDWAWTLITLNVPSPFARYVNSSHQLRLRLQSSNARDDADIDYEAILIGYSATVTPTALASTATSSPSATPTTVPTSLDVQVYNLDGFDTPSTIIDLLHLRGIKVMCYISAGTWENWRPDASNFPSSVLGNAVSGWPGENWLDIRQTGILLPLMEARMDICKSKGFDGVDPDNVDGYTNNTGFPLTAQDQLNYNIALSDAAHARGLAIGLKNDIDQIPALVPYFDWALNEQCFEYQECDKLIPFIQAGKPVFNIEYSLAASSFCPQANALNFNSLKKNLSLDAFRVACR